MTDQHDTAPPAPIRVVLVDDHAVVRSGLALLLGVAGDIQVVGEARDGQEALRVVAATAPDVVLMDLQMPELDGVAATRQITAAGSAQVLVLTSYSDTERILAALDAGAVGYLLKDVEPQVLLDGIRAVVRGDSPLHPRAARELVAARRGDPAPATGRGDTVTLADLTQREREVLGWVRAGLGNKQIARRLGISERTVKAHLTSAFQRIGVSDRTQAALWAERQRL
jgi:DNA-binding NarL/FixJ family response regulator